MASQARKLIVAALVAASAGVIYAAAGQAGPMPGLMELISVGSAGSQGNLESCCPAASASGRFIAFVSSASNLVANDTNGRKDVFVRDRETKITELISLSGAGQLGNADSYAPSINGDGRFVAFVSEASNLVPGDTNGQKDIFVRDRNAGVTERISVNSAGIQAVAWSDMPAISADGRIVAFTSAAFSLVAGDTNWQNDVFVRDRETGATKRISVSSEGVQGSGGSDSPAVSADGRWIAFVSQANNLVPGDTNAQSDVFLHDRQTGATERVSVGTAGGQANGASNGVSISSDGRYVAFGSAAGDLVADDTNQQADVFVRDRQTGVTRRVSVGSAGAQSDGWSDHPQISGDGSYIVYSSLATNLVPADTNGASDIFVYDLGGAVRRVSVSAEGGQGNGGSINPTVSQDARVIAFASQSTNLVANDINGVRDVFAQSLQNTVPMVNAGPSSTIDEGGLFVGAGHFEDPDEDVWRATVDYGDGSGFQPLGLIGKTFGLSHRYLDDGVYSVTVKVADSNDIGTGSTTITVSNVAPTVAPVSVSSPVIATGSMLAVLAEFTDSGAADQHIVEWEWGDGSRSAGVVTEANGSGSASGTHSYAVTGIYPLRVTVSDDDGAGATAVYQYVVVFDPHGPKVTGGGWFESPAGALVTRPEAVGRANLGLVAEYREGETPRGVLDFHLPGGDMRLHSDTFEWLVARSDLVELKGTGAINGAHGYGFVLAISDGGNRASKVWIRIWNPSSGALVYSSSPTLDLLATPSLELAGGRINVH